MLRRVCGLVGLALVAGCAVNGGEQGSVEKSPAESTVRSSRAALITPSAWAETATISAATLQYTQPALSGDTLVVLGNTPPAATPNAVHVFVRAGTAWTEQGAPLVPSDQAPGEQLTSVAISGDTIVVGNAYRAMGDNYNQGVIYVFVRNGTTWTQQAGPITAPDGANADYFGEGVAASGDTLAVTSSRYRSNTAITLGAVYLFVRSGGAWSWQATLSPTGTGTNDVGFGKPIALFGDNLAVGATGYSRTGNVLMFVRVVDTWYPYGGALAPADGQSSGFGSNLAMSFNTLVVGAPFYSSFFKGAGYVFRLSGGWTQQGDPLVPHDAMDGDRWSGVAVNENEDTVILTSFYHPNGQGGTGAARAFSFDDQASTWSEQGAGFAMPSPATTGQVGSPGIAGDSVILGAHVGTQNSVLTFTRVGQSCNSGDDCGSGHCADGVCCNTACDSPCSACVAQRGAPSDGVCGALYAGLSTACLPLTCNGVSMVCAACTDDSACPANRYCAHDGTCQPRKAQGASCNLAATGDCKAASCRECTAVGTAAVGGACVDGVCCDSACTGQCQACNQKNLLGTCSPVTGDPVGGRAACSGSGPCKAECNGAGACAFPGKSVTCGAGSCSVGGALAAPSCDGAGACTPQTKVLDCGPYLCASSTGQCASSCQEDSDCAAGSLCDAKTHACEPACTTADDCAADSLCVSGRCQSNIDSGSTPIADAAAPDGGDGDSSTAGAGSSAAPDGGPSAGDAAPPAADAGTEPRPDSGTAGSGPAAPGGVGSTSSSSSNGCGCSVPGSHTPVAPRGSTLLAFIALALVRRVTARKGAKARLANPCG